MFQKPTYEELFEENQMLKAIIKSLSENQERQETRIAELEAILKQNSQTSSKPPSSDGYKKPKPTSSRKKSDKSKGAQKGHKGSSLHLPHEPDKIVEHLPKQCESCEHKDV
ncbi:transposase [Dethiosulfovibrio peptidovorans DSM 11002]|uniref:Transposase n=1 Tax=Dethiosulfovibrio peptidovorans DSM 11002 TaxID=469381 RepID=D2Z3V3_9BACT|nr:DUF6444 domain-containing protein [Dethiosulfovibrio peptidovorans]EFC90409.1 transposase [Dethiosulfovibrio peptidovorans DSM 11002]